VVPKDGSARRTPADVGDRFVHCRSASARSTNLPGTERRNLVTDETSRNKATVRRLFDDIWNGRRLALIDEQRW
jgi:hypothetical protein